MHRQTSFEDWIENHQPSESVGIREFARNAHDHGYKTGWDAALELIEDDEDRNAQDGDDR